MMRVLLTIFVFLLTACGNAPSGVGTGTTAATTTTTTTAVTPSTTPTQIGLSLSKTSIKTDNTDSTTITAVVLDAGNAAVQNATVNFTSTGGQLSVASAVTDSSGKATTVMTSGLLKSNQTATVTGTVSGVSSQVPIQISGTTMSLSSGSTTNVTPTTIDRVTTTLLDAAGVPVYNVPVSFTQSGTGSVTIAALASTTDTNGQVQADIYGLTTGAVTLTATGGGATASQSYTATGTGIAFAVTSPAANPYTLSANSNLGVVVSVPAGITNVTFVTSLGLWGGASAVQSVPVVNNAASATFSSANAGIATVQVYDTNNPSVVVSTAIAVSQPSSQAGQISLQSNVNVVATSTADVSNSANLTATVRSLSGQAVGGAVVAFSMPVPPAGAVLSPVVAVTNSLGQASATFTSGSVSTGAQGVDIYAEVLGSTVPKAKSNIVVGGTAGSIVIGRASVVAAKSSTVYELPMSVLVADPNGNAVANASVTLKVFPSLFRMGQWVDKDPSVTGIKFEPCVTAEFANEDVNRNLILDAGEDVVHTTATTVCDPYNTLTGASYAANQSIDAPNSAAGTVPATVTTDASGIANFNLTYLKESAAWIKDEITASTQVLGTETTSKTAFVLPYLLTEGEAGVLPNSIFGK